LLHERVVFVREQHVAARIAEQLASVGERGHVHRQLHARQVRLALDRAGQPEVAAERGQAIAQSLGVAQRDLVRDHHHV